MLHCHVLTVIVTVPAIVVAEGREVVVLDIGAMYLNTDISQ